MPELFQVITATQANERLLQHLIPLRRVEQVSLAEALDRVTAENLYSPTNLPTFPRSTMDGFAVRAADTYGASEGLPAYLNLCGEVPMGQVAEVQVRLGEAARVHTGGMIPSGSDAVVMIENTQALDEQMIEVVRPVAVGENMLPVGDDVREGDLLFPRGHWVRPQDVGGLAGVGLTHVPVVARPRVAILATGDEVVPADAQPDPGQIRDINTHSVAALIRRAGGEPLPVGIAPDDADVMRRMAREALANADMLIISAGSSVSTRDMTAQIIAELGEPGVLVHGVSIKPGKPSILALADGKPVFGLPGNPVSTMIVYQLFVTPALYQLIGCTNPPARPFVEAKLAQNVASRSGSEDFVPVYLEQRDDGLWAVPIFGKSNLIYTMVRADGLLQIPLDQAGLYAEETITIQLF